MQLTDLAVPVSYIQYFAIIVLHGHPIEINIDAVVLADCYFSVGFTRCVVDSVQIVQDVEFRIRVEQNEFVGGSFSAITELSLMGSVVSSLNSVQEPPASVVALYNGENYLNV